ncbi:P-loop containing nucleoside triphosphate hydrolase protein [Radiomyces spectabilis]|uniref:P-loop containing nucleoside triphosphate hydrolase protein n=1 Tax=Radiomyces spectabilis TaxID=64574 RepID=UPI00221F85C8|nr:P-loop containing nucleoside triphosphate hydrolase protein [Radiomyces spectabilis]KAI8379708.1 P-loop containing nucleoside triphosphate hydrolase protein [Radiomyces spectabilis]
MPSSLANEISSVALREKLEWLGYESLEDLRQTGVIDLVKEIDLSKEEVSILLECIRGKPLPQTQTAAERVLEEKEKRGITLSCKRMDRQLENFGGIPPARMTEFCGESGTGKTQLCLQLAVNVQQPKEKGGLEGECVYIDTEGGCVPARLKMIAKSAFKDVNAVLARIHVFRVFDHVELVALIRQLPEIMEAYPKTKLLIIDSITFCLRVNVRDTRVRTGILNFVAQSLVQSANNYGIAVVATNHVSTDRIHSSWTPALGITWGHWCAHRFFLYRKRHQRYAYLFKTAPPPAQPITPFTIMDHGISDIDGDEGPAPSSESLNIAIPTEPGTEASWKEEQEEKDVWDQSFLTDEILSQLPSQLSAGDRMIEEVAGDIVPDSQSEASLSTFLDNVQDTLDPTHTGTTVPGKRKHTPSPPVTHSPEIWSSDENEEDWLFLAGLSSPQF